MKKFFTLIAMAFVAMGAMAQSIVFTENDAWNGTTFTKSEDGLVFTIESTSSSKGIDSNNQYFGDANEQVQFNMRVKTGGKSKSTDYTTITTPAKGTVIIYVRSSSGSAARNVTIGSQAFVVSDENFITVTMTNDAGESKDTKVFTPTKVNVNEATTIKLEYDGALNFYGITFVPEGDVEEIAPEITLGSTEVSGFVGTEISLTASGTGYPTPKVLWYQTADNAAAGGQQVGEGSAYKFTPDAAGTFYFYAVAENSKGKATSDVCTVTVTDTNIYLSEENEIIFTPECIYAAGQLDGVTIHGGALHLLIKDGAGKVSTEKSTAYFGTEEAYDKIEGRMKLSGKYKEPTDDNSVKLTSDCAGTLYLYAKSGSSNARALVFTQNGDVLFDDLFANSDAITVTRTNSEGVTEEKTVYPVYSFDIEAGEIDITRPNDTMQIYGISLDKNIVDGIKTVTEKAENAAIYNIAGQRVNAHVKGMKIQNGKKYIQK